MPIGDTAARDVSDAERNTWIKVAKVSDPVLITAYTAAGLTPQAYQRWWSIGITSDMLISMINAGITIEQAETYATLRTTSGIPITSTARDIEALALAKIPTGTVQAYVRGGIRTPINIADLHTWGCTPATVRAWMNVDRLLAQGLTLAQAENLFFGLYEDLCFDPDGEQGLIADTALLNALLAEGQQPTRADLDTWRATGLPTSRITFLLRAGIALAEATRPEIAATDDATLHTMIALRTGAGTQR